MKRMLLAGAAALSLGCLSIAPAKAATPVSVCDPTSGACIHVNADGSITTSGGGASTAQNLATGQATVGTSVAQLVASRTGRQSVTVISNCANAIELGKDNTLTTSNGTILPGVVGASVTFTYSGAIYAIGSTSCAVSYFELY